LIKIEEIEVFNFQGAFRGMRNPLESWSKSDSYLNEKSNFIIGKEDMKLALKLIKSGTDHSKFMRQILICMDIIAPLYWWKEADTYKIATVANSTSTMHKLGSKLLEFKDFSWDKITPFRDNILIHLNKLIVKWQKTDKTDKELWREIIQDLPDSFIQKRTWTGNYQILRNIYFARKNHKQQEWRDFCKMIEELPYSELITIEK
jgi:hypothetical protein